MPGLLPVLRHLANANAVQGGALLFGGGSALLMPEAVSAAPKKVRRGTWSTRGTMPVGKRRYRSRTVWAESAEGIRALKASMGGPARPVES